MLNSQALHTILTEPRFAYITHTERAELVGAILNLAKPDDESVSRLSEEAGDAQDTVASLCAAILDIAEHAGIVTGPVENMGDVLEALKNFVVDASMVEVTTLNACVSCNATGYDGGDISTKKACTVCNGSGIAPSTDCAHKTTIPITSPIVGTHCMDCGANIPASQICIDCNGSGIIPGSIVNGENDDGDKCEKCGGFGTTPATAPTPVDPTPAPSGPVG